LEQFPPDVLDRDSDAYKEQNHYRAHWQPLCAVFGLFGCLMMILFGGWPAIYLLKARNKLSTAAELKSPGSLIADVAGAYSGVCIHNPPKRHPITIAKFF
jgi:amino acid transporter